jgi:hypothetical protein
MLTKPPKRPKGKPRPTNTSQGRQNSQTSSHGSSEFISSTQGTVPEPPKGATPNRTPAQGTSAREMQAAMSFFKNGRFQIGKPLKEDVAFCPWNTVITYPGRFIGKTNRPRVSRLSETSRRREPKLMFSRPEYTSTRSMKAEIGICEPDSTECPGSRSLTFSQLLSSQPRETRQ